MFNIFEGCANLKTVYNNSSLNFYTGSEEYGYIAYYANLIIVNEYGFKQIDGVNTLVVYNGKAISITLLADYNGESYIIGAEAFKNNSSLTIVTIPNSVTSIGYKVFCGCSNLETLYISSAIESIGNYAFAECDKIAEIKVGAEKPIRGNTNIFTNAVYDNATLYVPNGSKSFYEKIEPWNLFLYIVEMDFTGIDDVKAESVEDNGIYYDLNGRAVENPANGIYIINGKKVLVK